MTFGRVTPTRRRKRKTLVVLVGALTVLVLVGSRFAVSAANQFIERFSRENIHRVTFFAKQYNISNAQAWFERAAFTSVRSVTWYGLVCTLELPIGNEPGHSRRFVLKIPMLTARLTGLTSGKIELSASQVSLEELGKLAYTYRGIPDSEDLRRVSIDNGAFAAVLNLSPWHLIQDVKARVTELAPLVRGGRIALPINFEGQARFYLGTDPVRARVYITQFEDGRGLVMDDRDIAEIITRFPGDHFTESEVELLKNNPIRAPRLLRIRNYAAITSREAWEHDGSVPQDPYRHILWSYLLAEQFGAEFSKEVTDAHEIGAPNSSEADHAMDFANNALGREYALKGIREEALLLTLSEDKRVVLAPRGVRTFTRDSTTP